MGKEKTYKIALELSDAGVQVLADSLNNYKGANKLTAYTLNVLIKRQLEIQKNKEEQ